MKTAYHIVKNGTHRVHKCNTRRRANQLADILRKEGHSIRIIPENRSIPEKELLQRYLGTR